MEISSKLSLYEFLTMLVVGLLIMFSFLPMHFIKENFFLSGCASFIIGLCYHRFLEILMNLFERCKGNVSPNFIKTIFCRNYHEAIAYTKMSQLNILNVESKADYFDAYYSIMDKPIYHIIIRLEAQVAFMKDLLFFFFLDVLIALIVGNSFVKKVFTVLNNISIFKSQQWMPNTSKASVSLSCLAIIIVLSFLIYFTQIKVYSLVWEGSKYTKK